MQTYRPHTHRNPVRSLKQLARECLAEAGGNPDKAIALARKRLREIYLAQIKRAEAVYLDGVRRASARYAP